MKSFLRLFITGMVMLCVTITAFAGQKKCYKKKIAEEYILILPEGSDDKKSNFPEKEYCTPIIIYVEKLQDDFSKRNYSKVIYEIVPVPFQEQDYSSPPFAPPRKHLLLM